MVSSAAKTLRCARIEPEAPCYIAGRSPSLAELDQLHAAGWRGAVFIVDDNFIGNKARAKELCVALTEWRSRHRTRFNFTTEASLNLADDPELMQLMKGAGFVSVFLGIKTPDESGLIASNKLRNTRSLLDSAATIQSFGIQFMGGFILGFDADRDDFFDRMASYWKFLLTVATRYRCCVPSAMTLAVMGYHFQVMMSRLSNPTLR